MYVRASLSVSLAAAAVFAVPGLSLATDPETVVVGQLISQLGDDAWTARRDAEAALVRQGVAALPNLQSSLAAMDAQADPEARARLSNVVETLRRQADVEGRTVTAQFDNAPAADALHELARQAEVEISLALPPNARITADFDKVPFLEAITQVCETKKWSMVLSSSGPRNLELLISDDPNRGVGGGLICSTGPALVAVRGGEWSRRVDFTDRLGNASRNGEFRFEFVALLEPRFQIGPREFEIEWTLATDASGHSLLPGDGPVFAGVEDLQGNAGDPDGPAAGMAGVVDVADAGERKPTVSAAEWTAGRLPFTVDLARLGHTIEEVGHVTLAGRIKGLVGTGLRDATADLSVTDPEAASQAKDIVWVVAGEPVGLRLSAMEPRTGDAPDRRRWAVSFEMLRPASRQVERLVVSALAEPQLTSADGTTFRRATTRSRVGQSAGVEYIVEFTGPVDAKPSHIACRIPERAAHLDLPFRFEKLPVP